MVKFVGKHSEISWVQTEFYSLDISTRKNYSTIGWPTRTLTEVYGPTSIGKSTFINSLSGVVGKRLDLPIACLDLEHQDAKTVEAIMNTVGFDGEWLWVNPDGRAKDDFSDEHLLRQLCKKVSKGYITILDSVASISPVAEVEGNIGDANMGRRAFPMAQYSRLINRELKCAEKGTISFMANHRYEKIATGLAFATFDTPGGKVKSNISHIRIEAKIPYIPIGSSKKLAHFGDGWVFEGKVDKNRFGLSKSDFWVYIVGGKGIHKGLTAMFDCVKLGLAEIKTGAKLYMKGTGEELGRVSKIISDKEEFDFGIFYNLLKAHQLSADDDAKLKEEENEQVEYTQDKEKNDE